MEGRCIDHIFFLSKAPLKQLFINAILFSFKDHALLIGGSSFKEWEIQANKKSILEYLINDHGFINTFIERMSTFSEGDDPNEFLIRFKTTHRGGLKLHLQSGQFVGLNRTAGEVSIP